MPPLPWIAGPAAEGFPGEVLVMASSLQLRSFLRIPGFFRAAMAIRQQSLRADGFVGLALNTSLPRRTFFTLSAWRDREALDAFVRSEPHQSYMRRYHPAMADSTFVFWNAQRDQLPPSWPQIRERLKAAG
jgi:heme-degrading monooxygenase HmoA